ncbi:MAG: NrfD/PsrC family molybdoenzyme membrane anchor subunit [Candidatus Hecatellaceae archaeon]
MGFLGLEEKVTWGILIATYLYLGGLAGGAFLRGSVAHILSREDKSYRVFARSGIYVGTVAIIAGFIPMIFTASGVSTGLVAAGLFTPLIGTFIPRLCPEFRGMLNRVTELMKVEKAVENFDIPLIIGEIILVFAYLLTVVETRGFATVVSGVLSGAFWVGFIVIGILIPVILWLLVKLRESPKLYQPVNFALIYLSFILVLIGGFALRYIVLFGETALSFTCQHL